MKSTTTQMSNVHQFQQDRLTADTPCESNQSRRAFLAGTMLTATGILTPNVLAEEQHPNAAQKPGTVDLTNSLAVTKDLVEFVLEAERKLRGSHLAPEEDIESSLEKAGVKIPDWLRGSGIMYEHPGTAIAKYGTSGIAVVTPGDPKIVEIRVFCVCIRKWRVCVCLECGWIWCRIVIIGTF